jgi:hypothetical protein
MVKKDEPIPVNIKRSIDNVLGLLKSADAPKMFALATFPSNGRPMDAWSGFNTMNVVSDWLRKNIPKKMKRTETHGRYHIGRDRESLKVRL